MYDAMIFDMDGTLVDFLNQIVKSWNESSKRHNWNVSFTYEQLKNVMGLNGYDIGQKLFPSIDGKEAEKRVQICSLEEIDYFKNVEIGSTFIPNKEFLDKLKSKYKLFIVSNCLQGYIETFLEKFGFENYFIDHLNASNGNTKAQNIATIVTKHNLKNPVYIGDTIKDKISSDEASVDFIFASYGFGNVENTKSIAKLEDLLDIE